MTIHSVVLAGGEGTRLGCIRKADLRLGGVRLIDRVANRLAPANGRLLVSVGPSTLAAPPGLIGIVDHAGDPGGPLAGILAAARHLAAMASPGDLLVSVAVDTPFLPEDYVSKLVAPVAAGARAAVSAWDGALYPTNAAWRLDALRPLLGDGTSTSPIRSPKRLLESLDATIVDWAACSSENPFANLNTLKDLVLLARRAIG